MPDKWLQVSNDWREAIAHAIVFCSIGLLVGLGQLLGSKDRLTPRIVIGRCLSTVGIALAAGAVLVAFPETPPLAQIGVSAALASLGTSGLERLIQRLIAAKG